MPLTLQRHFVQTLWSRTFSLTPDDAAHGSDKKNKTTQNYIQIPKSERGEVWRVVGSPVGAALFRFARRKAFLAAFSKKNLFADPAQVAESH